MTTAEAQTAKVNQLAAEYAQARDTYENSQLGPRTDNAWLRMERIMAKVEKLGAEAEAQFGKALGY